MPSCSCFRNLVTLGFTAALAASCFAGSITSADLPVGQQFVDLGWATVTASPHGFSHGTSGGWEGVGVQGGWVNDEIDTRNEYIRVDFAKATVVSEITLGFLFPLGTRLDEVFETARIDYAPGKYADLTARYLDGEWTGDGTVTNLSGVLFGSGVWQISNPFGDQAVSFLKFTAVRESGRQLKSAGSDYALISVSSVPGAAVPEPSTLGMLGLGIAALAIGSGKLSKKS